MFEGLFRRKQEDYNKGLTEEDVEKSYITGTDKPEAVHPAAVAHADKYGVTTFDTIGNEIKNVNSSEPKEYVHNNETDLIKDEFDKNLEKTTLAKRRKGKTPYRVSNERRKEKIGERNSGIPRGEDLVEEQLSRQEIFDDYLDANEEINHGFEDGEPEEDFMPESVPETYEEWKWEKTEEDQDLEKAA